MWWTAGAGRPVAPVVARSPGPPLDGSAAVTPLGPPSWRGVSSRLESLEAAAASEDAAIPSEDEEGVTTVVLPVSVERPISVSRESEEGEASGSDKLLESDIAGLFVPSVKLLFSQLIVLGCYFGLGPGRSWHTFLGRFCSSRGSPAFSFVRL